MSIRAKNKVAAFTLNEMILVLILTSIVVGLVFSVLTILQRRFHDIQKRFEQQTELCKLEQSLWIDFNRYNKIKYNDNENTLHFKSEIDSIKYVFYKDKIVKNLDTLHIQFASKNFFFKGGKTLTGNIDAAKFITSKENIEQSFFFYKKNDATQYMD